MTMTLNEVIPVERVSKAEVVASELGVSVLTGPTIKKPMLTICQHWKPRLECWSSADSYLVTEIPVGNGFDGRGFQLQKTSDTGTTYGVFVARNGQDHICDCAGFTFRSYCKHLDAMKHVIEHGMLEHEPTPPNEPVVMVEDDPFAGVPLVATDDEIPF